MKITARTGGMVGRFKNVFLTISADGGALLLADIPRVVLLQLV